MAFATTRNAVIVVLITLAVLIITFAAVNLTGLSGHMDYLNSLRKPAFALLKSDKNLFSKIGGLPDMPEDMNWPVCHGMPIPFLCQLDLSEIPKGCGNFELPNTGLLYFFYDAEQETSGYFASDKETWKVLYKAGSADTCTRRKVPDGLKNEYIYGEKYITLSPIEVYPDIQDELVDSLNLNDKQTREYIEINSSIFKDGARNQLLGYPSCIQDNDMDLECQFVSNGIDWDFDCESQCDEERAIELEAKRTDWMLLLQLDSDEKINMMWMDCGRLYFWIKKSDLEALNFENCWMILQCY